MIREATEADLPALLLLGRRMRDESPHFRKFEFSPTKLEATLRNLLDNDRGFIRVAVVDDQIIGVMVAVIFEQWFSTDTMAADLALYVEQEHRGGMTAVRLLREYKRWAWARGVVSVQAGISTEINVEQTARLYERTGMRRFGILLED